MSVHRTARDRAVLLGEELARFTQVVLAHIRPQRVLLFGSLAAGDIDEWSDLDLVVVAETDLPFYDRIAHVIRLVRPKVGMDILVYTPQEWDKLTRESAFIREEIVGKGRVVYERPSNPMA